MECNATGTEQHSFDSLTESNTGIQHTFPTCILYGKWAPKLEFCNHCIKCTAVSDTGGNRGLSSSVCDTTGCAHGS